MSEHPREDGRPEIVPLTDAEERSLALDAARLELADAMRRIVAAAGPQHLAAIALGTQIAVLNEFYAGRRR